MKNKKLFTVITDVRDQHASQVHTQVLPRGGAYHSSRNIAIKHIADESKYVYRSILFLLGVTAFIFLLSSCVSIPSKAEPVKNFKLDSYLGKWYEIARFDFKHEKDMNNVTAVYSLNENGSVKVTNRGYHTVDNEWKETIGKAKFVGEENIGRLKVSFFGPFYSGYNVIEVVDYKYALVCGNDLDYLWILSREKTIPKSVKDAFVEKAKNIGYDTKRFVWVKHND